MYASINPSALVSGLRITIINHNAAQASMINPETAPTKISFVGFDELGLFGGSGNVTKQSGAMVGFLAPNF